MPTTTVNDIQLHYELHGSGEPLVLIHGLGSSSRDWEYQIPDLARHYQVIAPSLRGFGKSDKPAGPYTVVQYARDVVGLLNHLGIDRAHVCGFSLGGAVAFQLAAEFKHRLSSVVVVNAQPSFQLDHWRKHLMVLMRIGMANVLGMQRMVRFLAKRLFPDASQAHLRETMLRRHGSNDKQAYLAALRGLAGWSIEDAIGSIDVPVLVVAGEHDITSVDEKQTYVDKMPNATLSVVKDSRHGTPFDQHETLNALILDFLDTTQWGKKTQQTARASARGEDWAAHGGAASR